MSSVRYYLKKIPFVRIILAQRRDLKKKKMIDHLIKNGSILNKLGQKTRAYWQPRIDLVQESTDNNKLNYVSEAGTISKDYKLVMHNGLLINPLSYYNWPLLELLSKNKGVHEPQEEFVFQEVLKQIPKGATMIELGAYWSFYSMWFKKEVDDGITFMIEPENIDSGIDNFNLNQMTGDFTKAYISDKSTDTKGDVPTICVDDFVMDKNIDFVDILHSDIQGYEFKMLLGATQLLDEMKVGYLFISTHSNEIHHQCLDHLKAKGYLLVCDYDLDESYSWDGLLVFKNPNYSGFETINISKRKTN